MVNIPASHQHFSFVIVSVLACTEVQQPPYEWPGPRFSYTSKHKMVTKLVCQGLTKSSSGSTPLLATHFCLTVSVDALSRASSWLRLSSPHYSACSPVELEEKVREQYIQAAPGLDPGFSCRPAESHPEGREHWGRRRLIPLSSSFSRSTRHSSKCSVIITIWKVSSSQLSRQRRVPVQAVDHLNQSSWGSEAITRHFRVQEWMVLSPLHVFG